MVSNVRSHVVRRLQPTGRLSQAVLWNGLLVTSGQVAGDDPPSDVEAQMHEVLVRIDAILAAAGTDRSSVLSAEVYLADMADFEAMNIAWDAWVHPDAQPTRVTIQTPMTRPEWRVAVAVTALVPGR